MKFDCKACELSYEACKKIKPDSIIKYLDANGWEHLNHNRKDISVYITNNGLIFSKVVVPLDEGLSDYGQAMYDCVKKISSVENRYLHDIIVELIMA